MSTEHTLRPDFYVIELLHNLDHWNLPEFADKIESSGTVYLFDKNVNVHCCEITPSYELHPVETRALLKPEFRDNDKLRGAVDEEVRFIEDHDVTYMHVRAVESLLAKGTLFKQLGDTGKDPKTQIPIPYSEVPYEEQFAKTLEYCQGNSQI